MTWLEGLTPLDFLMIGAVFAALLVGWVKGFVEVLSGFLVFVLATFVAGQYTSAGVNLLNRMWNLQPRFAEVLERRINLPAEAYKVQASAIPLDKAAEWLQSLPLPDSYKVTLAERVADWSASVGNQTAAEFITNQLAAGVISAATFLVMVTVLAWILALLVKLISDQIKEIPLVGTFNRLLGSTVMGFQVVVVLALAVGLLGPMLSMYGGKVFGNALQNAQLAPYLLTVYDWLRSVVFGRAGGAFFIV